MKLNINLLAAWYLNANSGIRNTWHTSQMSILLVELFLYKTTLIGGNHGWGKLINPDKNNMEWRKKPGGSLLGGRLESASD